jgi:hypothetical protein
VRSKPYNLDFASATSKTRKEVVSAEKSYYRHRRLLVTKQDNLALIKPIAL